jgi:hypothetical protein
VIFAQKMETHPEEDLARIKAVGRVPLSSPMPIPMPFYRMMPLETHRNALRSRFTAIDQGTDRIHIRLDHDHVPEFWTELSFSMEQLRGWLDSEGYVMDYHRHQRDEDDENYGVSLTVPRHTDPAGGPYFPRAAGINNATPIDPSEIMSHCKEADKK